MHPYAHKRLASVTGEGKAMGKNGVGRASAAGGASSSSLSAGGGLAGDGCSRFDLAHAREVVANLQRFVAYKCSTLGGGSA